MEYWSLLILTHDLITMSSDIDVGNHLRIIFTYNRTLSYLLLKGSVHVLLFVDKQEALYQCIKKIIAQIVHFVIHNTMDLFV